MPSIQDVGPVIRSAIATMQAGMAAQVAAFNAEAGNTVDLTVPLTYHFGACDTLSAYPFPQVEIAAVEGRLAGWSLMQADADHLIRVTVGVWTECMSGEVPRAYEESMGLKRCVLELLCQRGAFGATVVLDDTEGVYWRSDVIPADLTAPDRKVEKWRAPCFITFPLAAVETFG